MTGKKESAFLGNYLVLQRTDGHSIRFIRIAQLKDAPLDDQLVAALLRCDRSRAVEILENAITDNSAEKLAEICRHVNIAALLFDRACQLQLEDLLEQLRTADGVSLLSMLRHEAAVAISRFAGLDIAFQNLTGELSEFAGAVIWLKGTVLARSLYREPHFRLSEDFDIFIRWDARQAVYEKLLSLGFQPIFDDPGLCHQLGIGPVGSLDALAIVPGSDFEYCHNLALSRDNSVLLELKFDPLDQGLKMKELDRFAADAQPLLWNGVTFFSPDVIDHLLLELTHLHKHFFTGWQWLYDVHLLAIELNKTPDRWPEFIRRCQVEGITASAWAGLDLVIDWLHSPVPQAIMDELAPQPSLTSPLMFLSGTEFLWNTTSFPELLFEALVLGDRSRKLAALRQCIFPGADFLSRYYCNGGHIGSLNYFGIWLIHLVVLFLPGGFVRRTFGKYLWPVS